MINWQQEDRSTWRAFVGSMSIHVYIDNNLWAVYTTRDRNPIMFSADTPERAKRKALKIVLECLRAERNKILALDDMICEALD